MKERSPSRDGVGLTHLKNRIEYHLESRRYNRCTTITYLSAAFAVKESTIRRALSEMMADGLIEPIGTVKAQGATGRPRKVYRLKAVPRG